MKGKINVFIKDPGRAPRHFYITASPGKIKKLLGLDEDEQYRIWHAASDLVIIHAGDRSREISCNIGGQNFYGRLIICGAEREDLKDTTVSHGELKLLIPQLWKAVK